MASKLISIDFDNILSSTTSSFLTYFAQKKWKEILLEEMRKPYLFEYKEYFGFEQKEFLPFYNQFLEEHTIQPVAWSIKWVHVLKELWCSLVILSWRNKRYQELTELWLETYFDSIFDDVILTSELAWWPSKWEVCEKIGAETHIDDFYHYATTIAEKNIKTLLFSYPRNQEYTWNNEHIIKISGREQVPEHI